jgi:hypothetical protein
MNLSSKHPNKERNKRNMKIRTVRNLNPSIRNVVPSLVCALILFSIHSCATVPTTNAQSQGNRLKNSEKQGGSEDEELSLPAHLTKAEAVKFSPPAGMANLYIIRREAYLGCALNIPIGLDGQQIGSLQTGSFFLKVISPGNHILSSFTQAETATKTFKAREGENIFYDIKGDMGLISMGTSIHKISDEDAKAAVRRCKRAIGI